MASQPQRKNLMDDLKLDGRKWRFLDKPDAYINSDSSLKLKLEPLKRQFKTAKHILTCMQDGRGVLLADDVGLGKTTVGALVAWAVACQGKRVRIYAPNDVLRRRWAKELEDWAEKLKDIKGASADRIKQGKQGSVKRLHDGRIQVTTHSDLVKSHTNRGCDLMIIDEAHRAKGEESAFSHALNKLGGSAKRKLILTATPFSIRIKELVSLLKFVGATNFDAVTRYADDLERLYTLGDGHDAKGEAARLVQAAEKAIEEIKTYIIRHSVEDLPSEKKHYGEIGEESWEIQTPRASDEDVQLLLRVDRILQLAPERKGERRNDPRFHVGWQHIEIELACAAKRVSARADDALHEHIRSAQESLKKQTHPHPKIAAVCEAIRPVIDGGEKVLVFCHHRATASELLGALEIGLRTVVPCDSPSEEVWREAWKLTLLPNEDSLINPLIDWFCSPGLRAQLTTWIGEPARTAEELAKQFENTRPRHSAKDVPTIRDAARRLSDTLLDKQSKSTRAVLNSIGKACFGSRFPGRLDEGFRAMGAWDQDDQGESLETLYTGQPDIVLALFNSPFGPDVLVATDRLSEGVDLHRCCRHLIHYELDPSPVRTIQRNGRIRRVGSWAAVTQQPIRYAYPMFKGTRDEKATEIMRRRIDAFGILLGGVPTLDSDTSSAKQSFADSVLNEADSRLCSNNKKLCVTGK